MCRIILVALALIVQNASAFDLSKEKIFSVLLLPDTRAVVGVVAEDRAGFALCKTEAGRFMNCRLISKGRFTFSEMDLARVKFEKVLEAKEQTLEEAGRELGMILGLRLSPGQVAAYYGFKRLYSSGVPVEVIRHHARVFNSDLNSPPVVQFDAAGGAVTTSQIIEALQFAASAQE